MGTSNKFTVSHHEIPPFETLVDGQLPFPGLGKIIISLPELERNLYAIADRSRQQLRESFHVPFEHPDKAPIEIDGVVAEMWRTGWNPDSGNINLFIRDLGSTLATSMLQCLKGSPVFRSQSNLNHFSIWWPTAKVEAFPFHKMVKCLYNRDGESAKTFVEGIANRLHTS